MRSLYCFGAAAALLGASVLPSGATTITATSTSTPPGASIGLGSSPFSTLTFTADGSFTDFFNFEPTASGQLTANALEGTSFGSNVINPFTISLVQVSPNTVLGSNSTPSNGSNTESVSIGGIAVTGGVEYYVEVTGDVTATNVSSTDPLDIDGNVTLQPAPLPGALALFGSALVGFWGCVRRRKSKDAAPLTAAIA